jgi:hypothetical protein
METKDTPAETKEGPAEKKERAVQRAQKREDRAKRKAAHKEKAAESGKGTRICSLTTVGVKKDNDGFHVVVNGSGGRKAFTIARSDASMILRDLETAIKVMRGQV